MNMNWYTWSTQEDFNNWHQSVISGLQLPKVGVNQATGNPEPDKNVTTEYTSVTEVAADDWRAPVEPQIAADYPDGLGNLSSIPPTPEEIL